MAQGAPHPEADKEEGKGKGDKTHACDRGQNKFRRYPNFLGRGGEDGFEIGKRQHEKPIQHDINIGRDSGPGQSPSAVWGRFNRKENCGEAVFLPHPDRFQAARL
jgi:hypothetical protein